MHEDLREARDSWIDMVAMQVSTSWLPRVGLYADQLLPSWVARDTLALATLAGSIAIEDVMAQPTEAIVERLQGTGLVLPGISPPEVLDGIVLPVIRNLRYRGAPWRRWWDIGGLHALLVELWVGRRREKYDANLVRTELRAIWQVPDAQIATVMDNLADPFVHLPADLLWESKSGIATQLYQGLVRLGRIRLATEADVIRTRPALADRGELVEIVLRHQRRVDFEIALRQIRDIPATDEAKLRLDLEAWDERFDLLLAGLTTHEAGLLMVPDQDELYREECLIAGQGVYEYWLQQDDSFPSGLLTGRDASVPGWIHDEVITGGGRSFRTNVGPHPIWLATADTPETLAAIHAPTISESVYGIRCTVGDDMAVVRLVLPLPPVDTGPPIEIPYSYPLDAVNSAWQLVHLAAVGYVRLTVLSLRGDGDLRIHGTVTLQLPPAVCDELTAAGVQALRRLVADDTQQILWRRTMDGLDRAAQAAFHGNEIAKGEELREEFAVLDPHPSPAWQAFGLATRRLAYARARHAVAVLDGLPDLSLRSAVDQAIEDRQRHLEIARADSPNGRSRRGNHEDDEVVAALCDDKSAFAHLFIKNDRMSSVIAWLQNGSPYYELQPYSDIPFAWVAAVASRWIGSLHASMPNGGHDDLLLLLAASSKLLQPIADELVASGIRRLFLSPTPPLDLLPLHVIPVEVDDDPVMLCDVFEDIVYMPSAQTLRAIAQPARRCSASDTALVVAHTGSGIVGVDASQSALIEAEMVADIYRGSVRLSETAATPDAVLEAMATARIVHITCHGHTHSNRWASGIILHGETLGEATLTTSRILAGADLSAVDLVVLNACRTGTHESADRIVQTLRGVESVFLARGAKAVISTLWEITNIHSLVFSALLHTWLEAGVPANEAYRYATRFLRWGQWRSSPRMDVDQAAVERLDRVFPEWRHYLSQQADNDPLFWGAFKFTGAI
ncbi:CHAT domain-containing protein [Nonomuraea turcica]|uniref:CHAT domain-containing protein n=1 Tax=Nonomuraea sp. G32 TaxID=3067274 RepID=UPI00273B1D53|nr:CHAT domain-containing protein [Nonomuraea sp. G32]MDP4510652.1 CHAT domain-containing protein [Nonomuraea sp. G32]